MQAARALALQEYPYLDTALTSMTLHPVLGLGTVATDVRWRMYYDPERALGFGEQRIKVLVSDWVHEVMHCLSDHSERWRALNEPASNARIWNLAADVWVNHHVHAMDLPLLDTDVTLDSVRDLMDIDMSMTTEGMYFALLAAAMAPPGRDCGSGAGGDTRPWELDQSDGAADGSIGSFEASVIRQATAQAVKSWDAPAGLTRWADGVLNPQVDWRRELRSSVARRLAQTAGRTDYTFGHRARRQVPGFSLPGMAALQPPSVAVVIDTSSSMSQELLVQCVAELSSLLRLTGRAQGGLRMLCCDSYATVVQDITSVGQISLTGGGGTDMRVGIAAAAELRPRTDVVIVLTDGYTPWPDSPPLENPGALYVAGVMHTQVLAAVPSWMKSLHIHVD